MTEEPPSIPGSPFSSGFVDRAKAGYRHAREVYREVKKHGVSVVLPSDEEAAAWLRSVKEDCLDELDECLKDKARKAADELNAFRKKPREEQLYTAGGWAFDALVSTAATVVTPGGGLAASTAVKEGERAAAKGAAKAALRKAGKELGEEAAEHVDEAAARRVLREAEERAAREAAEAGAEQAADGATKLRAKDRRTREQAQSREEKHGDPDFEEPASEEWVKWRARGVEKEYGKDARRQLHDQKKRGEGDRSERQVTEDANDRSSRFR